VDGFREKGRSILPFSPRKRETTHVKGSSRRSTGKPRSSIAARATQAGRLCSADCNAEARRRRSSSSVMARSDSGQLLAMVAKRAGPTRLGATRSKAAQCLEEDRDAMLTHSDLPFRTLEALGHHQRLRIVQRRRAFANAVSEGRRRTLDALVTTFNLLTKARGDDHYSTNTTSRRSSSGL
jgi:hypothetical protein